MKITPYQPITNLYKYNKAERTDIKSNLAHTSFTSTVHAYKDLVKTPKKLISEGEYKDILNKIRDYKGQDEKPIFNFQYNLADYPKIKKDQEGLLLYAGCGDLSDEMNRFLSKRELKKLTPVQAKEVISAFDYSLNKLDEKFGKYSGIVYRQGFFEPGSQQYISTTTDPVIAATLRGGICMNKNLEFSLLKVKNGHKINEFQRKMGSDYAEEEEEILISGTSKLREVKTPYGQLLTLKNNFKKTLEDYAHQEINPDKIRIFEEI